MSKVCRRAENSQEALGVSKGEMMEVWVDNGEKWALRDPGGRWIVSPGLGRLFVGTRGKRTVTMSPF